MVKATAKNAPAHTGAGSYGVAPVNSPFAIVEDSAPPAPGKFGGGRSADDNPYRKAALALPLPTAEGKHYAFQVPVTVADTITNPEEKAKAIKEAGKKLLNAIGGVTRRLTKNDPALQFTVRSVDVGTPPMPHIKVWRMPAKEAVPATPAQ